MAELIFWLAAGSFLLAILAGSSMLSVDRVTAAFRGYARGYQADGWPLGLQEEDLGRPWGRTPPRSRRTPRPRTVRFSRRKTGG
jgi:hypothetical protein